MLFGDRMVQLTEEQLAIVMTETGATREYVLQVAERLPEVTQINVWWPGKTVIKSWACFRNVFTIGPFRKVLWSIACTILANPIIPGPITQA